MVHHSALPLGASINRPDVRNNPPATKRQRDRAAIGQACPGSVREYYSAANRITAAGPISLDILARHPLASQARVMFGPACRPASPARRRP